MIAFSPSVTGQYTAVGNQCNPEKDRTLKKIQKIQYN